LNYEQIKALLAQGENSAVEYKSALVGADSGVFHYDAVGVEGTSINSLNQGKLDEYFRRYEINFQEEPDKEQLLKNADIMTDGGLVTVAGLLIFGINPQRHLRSAYISFAHFAGDNLDDVLIDKQDITGNLDHQIDTTLSIIKNNLLNPSIIVGAKRVETTYRYPDKIFRELLVNACAHRNYAIAGSQIRVFMFSDRIEFHSPGKLPNAITKEKLVVGVTAAVNPIIIKFLNHLSYIDKLGRGIPIVYREAMKQQKILSFEELGEAFTVRLGL
jgi:ATP-dependent DNA helicase RecG